MSFKDRVKKDKVFLILVAIATLLVSLSLFAPILAPHDPLKNNYSEILLRYSPEHLLGTDQIGRDILSRLIYGGQTTLLVVSVVLFITASVGIGFGVISAYLGGYWDDGINALCEFVLSIPETVIVIAIISILGPGIPNTILAMCLVGWPEYMRLTRNLVGGSLKRHYVQSAYMSGYSHIQVIFKIILPNLLPYLIVTISQDIGNKILTLSGLSLLGLAAQPPIPEWGAMLSEGRRYIQSSPWMILYPGVIILLHVIVFNLLGDRMRDILDPKMKQVPSIPER